MNLKTVVIQIGNSDDSLTQRRWASFIEATGDLVLSYAHEVHFSGHAFPDTWYQNACFVFTVDTSVEQRLTDIESDLAFLARHFDQDSIALTLADSTQFVPGSPAQ